MLSSYYARIEGGPSWGRDAGFREPNQNSPNCFLMNSVAVPRCSGDLDHLGTGWGLGGGVGFWFAPNIRGEIIFTHRNGFELKGVDPGNTFFDADLKSDAIMVNGIFQLPVAAGSFKPYVGAGIGRARNKLKPVNWNDPTCCRGTLTGGNKSDFAWQLMVGADVAIAQGWVFEIFYRYADLGKFVKDAGRDLVGGPFNPSGITDSASGKLRTNEVMVAVRREFR